MLLYEGLKRGYIKEYVPGCFSKNEGNKQCDENYVSRALTIMRRSKNGNIILSGKDSLSNCPFLDSVVTMIKNKTGYQELDALKLYIFDPAAFSGQYMNSSFASRHLEYLINEIVRKGSPLLIVNDIRQILYDSYLYRKNNIDLKTKIFYELAQKCKLRFIGTMEPDDSFFGSDKEYMQEKWKEYVEVMNLPDINTENKTVSPLITEKSGISVNVIDKSKYLEQTLTSRIIGQNHVAKAVSQAIRTVNAGLADKNRPNAIFYFLGPSGVGKTEFAQVLAETLYGSNSKLLRIDMSELTHPGDVTRLIGGAPSYVGYEQGGVLTNWAKNNPSSVILLDEFEKAHPKCWDLFLQMFDAGRLRDGHGQVVDFTNTIIILTSNIGSENFITKVEAKSVGFLSDKSLVSKSLDLDRINDNIHSQLADIYRPEFLNRIDEVFIFNPLSIVNLIEITKLMLKSLPVKLIMGYETVRFIAQSGYNPQYGARHLKRAIKRLILDPVANMIVEGQIQKGDTVKVNMYKQILSFNKVR